MGFRIFFLVFSLTAIVNSPCFAEGGIPNQSPALPPTEGALSTDPSVWPNTSSWTNSDSWLVRNHQRIRLMRPGLLVLNFANPSDPLKVQSLIQGIIDGFAEASRSQGFKNPRAKKQLEYRLVKRIIDLRDGVAGRPPAPQGFAYQNSTLFPRRPAGSSAGKNWGLDYSAFFNSTFARYYGFADPDRLGRYLDLCSLINHGDIHELWFVGSSDVPDVSVAEVLEEKPGYDMRGKPLGTIERCSGNGCFDDDVPFCGRSIRIGYVNYKRGSGCYIHSEGHDLESEGANTNVLPALKRWFQRYARFDLNTKFNLPFSNLYAVSCEKPPCIAYSPGTTGRGTAAQIVNGSNTYDLDPFDPACGNVHFSPLSQAQYDYDNKNTTLSSCVDFGRHGGTKEGTDALSLVHESLWTAYGSQFDGASDCGGDFLIWWYQNMPGYKSGQTYSDGTPMQSVWPFRFY